MSHFTITVNNSWRRKASSTPPVDHWWFTQLFVDASSVVISSTLFSSLSSSFFYLEFNVISTDWNSSPISPLEPTNILLIILSKNTNFIFPTYTDCSNPFKHLPLSNFFSYLSRSASASFASFSHLFLYQDEQDHRSLITAPSPTTRLSTKPNKN